MTAENKKIILIPGDRLDYPFSSLFLCEKDSRAVRVMKSYRHPDNAGHRPDWEEHAFNQWMRNMHFSEQKACDTVSESPISQYFLNYYPDFEIEKIIEKQGLDISAHYLPECSLVFDLIRAPHFPQYSPVVRTYCIQENVELDLIFGELKRMGIMHYKDASVLFNRFGNPKVLIGGISMKAPDALRPPEL